MSLVIKDRISETTTTSGTSDLALGGATPGYQSFAVIGDTNTVYYCITDGNSWEVGLGTYSTTGPTLARTTVYSNSLGTTAKISLTVGVKNVFAVYPAEAAVTVDVPNALIQVPSNAVLPVANGGTGSNSATFSGANITSLNASNISAGTLAVARGGTGSSTATFSGANITSLNASNISSGTIGNSYTTASSSNGANTIVSRDANGDFSARIITATTFSGSGASITSINASNISAGTIGNAYTTAASANGASTIVARDATGNFSANVITADGSALTALNASSISSGTLANARTTAASANGASTIIARDASGGFLAATVNVTTLNSTGLVIDSKGDVRTIPPNSQTTTYTLATTDIGKFVSTNSNVTVPNATFATGDVVSVFNSTGSNISILSAGSVTVRQAGTSNTGTRTLQQYGVATVLCTAANNFVITGSGLA